MLSAKNIRKSFNGVTVLNDVSLDLNEGEITVILGPSGCGKTTLLRNISLLDVPDSGTLNVFDRQYNFPLLSKVKDFPYPFLTVVFQQLFLWPHLTNRDNILLAVENNAEQSKKANSYLDYLIEKMEMSNYIDNYPNQSSLGQKQRIAIARALILRPKIVLFDEITAALDIQQTRNIIKLLLEIKSENTSVSYFFVTHNINIASHIADKLLYMDKGKIVEFGGKELLANPNSIELNQFLNLQ